MSPRAFVALVGAALIVLGMALGLAHHSAPAAYVGSVSCGSAFSPDVEGTRQSDNVAGIRGGDFDAATNACEKALPSPAIGWSLIGVGIVAIIGAAAVRGRPEPAPTRARDTDE